MHRAGRVVFAALLGLTSCRDPELAPSSPPTPLAAASPGVTAATIASFPDERTLLIPQARFVWETGAAGKQRVVPQAAALLLLRREGASFRAELLEDPESRVFHKAACVDVGDGPRLLTIGGTAALAKLWRRDARGWQADTLWRASFGGKWDRLRDFEIGDVDGDGRDDLVFATHDQGVVAVAHLDAAGWRVLEVDRQADTFVHEIEIGDTDGDGRKEFFATPSTPNKVDAAQSGSILGFRHTANRAYRREVVARFSNAHVKEILTADLDGDGRDELYAAVEPERTGSRGLAEPAVEVRRYTPRGRTWHEETVAKIPGGAQARVLIAADLTGSGRLEIIATTMRAGIWRLVPAARGKLTLVQIDAGSGGFEHAAGVADLDGDGKMELYVSADDRDEIRRYVWTGRSFARDVVYGLDKRDLGWNVLPCIVRRLATAKR